MKLFLIAIVGILSQICVGATIIREVEMPIEHAFIPFGFDDNDSVQVVLSGRFPTTCFKRGLFNSDLDAANKIIRIQLIGFEYEGTCQKVPLRFNEVVPLGRIRSAGNYALQDKTTGRNLGVLNIAVAESGGHGTDNVLYAPLLDAFLVRNLGSDTLILSGVFPSTCMELKKVDVKVFPDVVVVLPEVELRKENCEISDVPFTRRLSITETLPQGEFLLHVRSIAGQAINKIVPAVR